VARLLVREDERDLSTAAGGWKIAKANLAMDGDRHIRRKFIATVEAMRQARGEIVVAS
jgi:hypothetical protein